MASGTILSDRRHNQKQSINIFAAPKHAGPALGSPSSPVRRARSSCTPKVLLESDVDRGCASALRGDAARLGVVLSNILSNALKYTPPGGTIHVVARPG
jgi:signal transduction histidine kinase